MAGDRRQYPTELQVRAAAASAKAVGIERIGALTLSPTAFYAGSFLELVRRSLAKFGTGSYYARAATTPTPENVSG